MNEKALNIIGLVNTTSYGGICRNILETLLSYDCKICLFPVTPNGLEVDENSRLMVENSLRNAQFFSNDSPSVKIWHHEWGFNLYPGKGKRYNWTIFELDKFTPAGIHSLKYLDGIIVCSEWAKQVVKDNGLDVPTYVVPLGVDVGNIRKNPNNGYKTRFVHCGKWEVRKRQYEIIQAFEKAFTIDDHVELIFITANRLIPEAQQKAWEQMCENSSLSDKIYYYKWLPNNDTVYKIIADCDCGVFLNSAEGFNLPLLECLLIGLPVIALNYSAPTQYLSKDNAMLIEPGELIDAYDGVWFHGNMGKWASVGEDQIEQCVKYMREIHHKKQSKADLTNHTGIQTGENFTWSSSVTKLLEAIC